jgi:spore maturation protein CgeB
MLATEQRMRFLQINTYYPAYLQDFYTARPGLLSADYQTQIDALLDDGFSDSHIFSRALKEHGFETFQVAINNPVSQNAWLTSQGLPMKTDNEHPITALQQIESFAPDIVYTTDVVTLSSSLLRRLKTRPRVVSGWRGYPLPETADLSAYDLILTSFDRIFEEAKIRGAKSIERFHPGFPENISVLAEPREPRWDVVFSGSVTPKHGRRIALINLLAEVSRDPRSAFSFGIFMPEAKFCLRSFKA